MRLWRRATGILKDQNSLWLATFSRRTALRNPDIEAAVIKSTNHDETWFDSRHIDRVRKWIGLFPFNLKPFLWSVSNRLEKTRSWVVALKGLYLMHTVINCDAPCIKKIGRLPFDLANFTDAHSSQAKTWSYNAFIRAYYAFLDQKSTLVFQHSEEKRERTTIKQELLLLQKLQGLIDLLVQIKPQSQAALHPLVLEAMDEIIVEVFDIYSRICRGIAIVLMNIYSADKAEAVMALKVVQKAAPQGKDLSSYFEFCQEIGIMNASELPSIARVPEEGIRELEYIIDGFWEKKSDHVDEWMEKQQEEEKAIILMENPKVEEDGSRNDLRTIITQEWEKFEEDLEQKNPFESPLMSPHSYTAKDEQELPDLIIF